MQWSNLDNSFVVGGWLVTLWNSRHESRVGWVRWVCLRPKLALKKDVTLNSISILIHTK